jgi:hypothetical protein
MVDCEELLVALAGGSLKASSRRDLHFPEVTWLGYHLKNVH